ncbi:flagellar basal body rod protein FlgG [Salimicrobium halophilum]|uniref:Flagellar hook protein FlgE n=1 Tax=Salimicrobium halophilum TaxID=86666 RepID=A0A1G8QAW5_9BACI|nr:flagellar basal body rod protein FlgG [Salimicrobium halophilum]SDJ01748.1 flagellar hook protein FlgE [Salimicrobium halophilum]
MLRSMYAGISGMKGFQTKLDTIGNNIANVNTFGFKKGRATFQDMMSQTVSAAQGPQGEDDRNLGGVNAKQVGLGSELNSIDNVHTQGNRQTTNRSLDLAIEGDGMFALAESPAGDLAPGGEGLPEDAVMSFTRAGNFYLDSDGAIVNGNGKYLVGQSTPGLDVQPETDELGGIGTITIPNGAQSFNIQPNGEVNYIDEDGTTQVAGRVALANFSNPEGLRKIGGNEFQNTDNAGWINGPEDGDGYEAANFNIPGQNGTGSMISGALEMSNVDLSEEFTEMITAQRGFQANTRIITTSDEILNELVNLKR